MGLADSFTFPLDRAEEFGVEAFNRLLASAFEAGASDIFIESGGAPWVKIDGRVAKASQRKFPESSMEMLLAQAISPAAETECINGKPQYFDYKIVCDGKSVLTFRAICVACEGHLGLSQKLSLVLRTIPGLPPTVEELGIEQDIIEAMNGNSGICLVAGATGSGKSTTMAAVLRRVSTTEAKHIITYENPVEFSASLIPNKTSLVVQSEVPGAVPDFETAVAVSMRRAPDIIQIGEASSHATIRGAILAAQTGHMVWTTVHTNNVPMTLSRMIDNFSSDERRAITSKLVDATRLIVHQQLVPKLGGGRIALREYLIFTKEIREAIHLDLMSHDDPGVCISQMLADHGRPLMADVLEKFRAGLMPASVFADIALANGAKEQIGVIRTVANELREKDVINDEEHRQWLAISEAAS